jgi:hypothetical protein
MAVAAVVVAVVVFAIVGLDVAWNQKVEKEAVERKVGVVGMNELEQVVQRLVVEH